MGTKEPFRYRSRIKPVPPKVEPPPRGLSSIEAALTYFLMEYAPEHALDMSPNFLADFAEQRKLVDFVELKRKDGSIVLSMVQSAEARI